MFRWIKRPAQPRVGVGRLRWLISVSSRALGGTGHRAAEVRLHSAAGAFIDDVAGVGHGPPTRVAADRLVEALNLVPAERSALGNPQLYPWFFPALGFKRSSVERLRQRSKGETNTGVGPFGWSPLNHRAPAFTQSSETRMVNQSPSGGT